jgi:hypothetical protein
MNSIQQTRFFAQNYSQLQGLRAVPLGLCLLVITLWANLQHGPARDLTFPILVALACLVFYLLVDRYYNREYGKVKHSITRTELLLQAAGAVLALAAFFIDTRNVINISLLGLVFAVVFAFSAFWYWRLARVVFVINLILAIFLALLSLSPLVGIQEWWNLLGLKYSLLAYTFLYGVFGVLVGIILHIYFIRSLPTTQEPA